MVSLKEEPEVKISKKKKLLIKPQRAKSKRCETPTFTNNLKGFGRLKLNKEGLEARVSTYRC